MSLLFLVINFCMVHAQQELISEIKNQTIVIDSLSKVIKKERDDLKLLNEKFKIKTDSINGLKSTLSKLEKFKNEKKKFDEQLKLKSDSISTLIKQKNEITQKISDDKMKYEQNMISEKEKTRLEFLNQITNFYNGKSFDELILNSSKNTIERDLKITGTTELKLLLNDLKVYFEARDLLDNRFNAEVTKTKLDNLNKIKQQSVLLEKLKDQLENYQSVNNGLIECLKSLIDLDMKGLVMSNSGHDKEVIQLKLNKIQTQISKFIFDFDFNHADYPYLSNVLSKVIKLKVPNPDADISKLLKNIE